MSDARVALVTGATRGIGKAIAEVLARQGTSVIGTATTDAGAASVSEQLKQFDSNNEGIRLDVTDGAGVEAVVSAIAERHGNVTILVNNAGITRDNLLLRMQDAEWDSIMDTNLKSAYRLSKAVLRGMMRARYGRVISVGSVVGLSGNAGQTNYAAAKAALIGFTKSLAQEVGSRNITVNAIAPGFIDVGMSKGMSDEVTANFIKQIPLGRLGNVNEIVNAALFLASPMASYITGHVLNVNGGFYMG